MERKADRFSRIADVYLALKKKLLPIIAQLVEDDPATELLTAQAAVLKYLAPMKERETVETLFARLEEGRALTLVLAYALGHELETREALAVPYPVTQIVEADLSGDWTEDGLAELGVNGHERDFLDACAKDGEFIMAQDAYDRAYELCPDDWWKRLEEDFLFPFRSQVDHLAVDMYRLGREAARKEQGQVA